MKDYSNINDLIMILMVSLNIEDHAENAVITVHTEHGVNGGNTDGVPSPCHGALNLVTYKNYLFKANVYHLNKFK